MGKKSNEEEIKITKPESNVQKFTAQQLFESKRFKTKYQRDFGIVVLGDKTYTPTEAEIVLDQFFKRGKK